MAETVIELSDIVQRFGEKEVLKGISLQVERGEVLGLLGPSGAGKTTLIKLITGQLVQSSGTAVIFGRDSRELDGKAYARIGMMMDDFGLYERLSVFDNLKLFADIQKIGKESIYQVLEEVGLQDAIKQPVGKLSKGMKSRLVLARAILHEPDILFLDEPTSGLDPATTRAIHQLIRKLQKGGTTMFLTTHNMAEAEALCTHVALLNEGTIVEYGAPDEICNRYNHQNSITICFYDGTRVELINGKSSAGKMKEYLEAEQIKTIHSSEPDLETVFMELTGRRFE